jgi:hypothetical protein
MRNESNFVFGSPLASDTTNVHRLGYIVSDDGPKDYIELLGTLVISEQGLAISGTWGGKTDWLSFELKHVSTAAVNIKLLGEFSFNGSFDYAGERVPEKCVNVLVSSIDKGALSKRRGHELTWRVHSRW